METTRRIGPWTALALLVLAFVVLQGALTALRATITFTQPHDIVAWRAAGSIVLVWSLFGAVWLILKARGQSLAEIGWMRPSRLWGWLLALVFAALYGGATAFNMARLGAPVLTDWSLWRIAVALGIGISAGICEETVFRGFVMGQAKDAGVHWSIQILLSALLFGLAHVGWGAMSGHVQVAQIVGAASATAVLGLMMAVTYLAAGRSLAAPIVAHGVIDILIEPWLLLYAITGGHF